MRGRNEGPEAIGSLPTADLEREYAAAWDEWRASGQADAWEVTAVDGVDDTAR